MGGQVCASLPIVLGRHNEPLPGSFHEFYPVIKPLTQSWTSPTGKKVSFNVVVPSLPGFVFSSAPPVNWTVDDTARIFNTLMTEVLGYSTYTTHGTDWVYLYRSQGSKSVHSRSSERALLSRTPSTIHSTQPCAHHNLFSFPFPLRRRNKSPEPISLCRTSRK
jgi:hypothetical protein